MVSTVITEQQAKQYKATACRELLPNIRGVLRFPVLVERNNQLETLESALNSMGKGPWIIPSVPKLHRHVSRNCEGVGARNFAVMGNLIFLAVVSAIPEHPYRGF